MAQFVPVPGDKTVMFDKGVGRLLIPLGGSAQIQLWGGAKQDNDAWPLIVDVNDPRQQPSELSGYRSRFMHSFSSE